MKEYFTMGVDFNPQYGDFVKYAKSRITFIATALNNYVAGKCEAVAHHEDWMEDECDETLRLVENFPDFNGRYTGFLFLHKFEEYAVYHSDIPNEEKKTVFNAIYKIAFSGALETARLTDDFFMEKRMTFNAYAMYKELEEYVLSVFYSVTKEEIRTYSYLYDAANFPSTKQ